MSAVLSPTLILPSPLKSGLFVFITKVIVPLWLSLDSHVYSFTFSHFYYFTLSLFHTFTLSSQAANPVLLLQPDCAVPPHLLHGNPWIHSSSRLWREAGAWYAKKQTNKQIQKKLNTNYSNPRNHSSPGLERKAGDLYANKQTNKQMPKTKSENSNP